MNQKSSELCSSFFRLQIVLENFSSNLKHEIEARRFVNQQFLEKEIWTIIIGAVSALAFLQLNKVSHQCLQASQIFIVNQSEIKLTDPRLFGQLSNYQVFLTNVSE